MKNLQRICKLLAKPLCTDKCACIAQVLFYNYYVTLPSPTSPPAPPPRRFLASSPLIERFSIKEKKKEFGILSKLAWGPPQRFQQGDDKHSPVLWTLCIIVQSSKAQTFEAQKFAKLHPPECHRLLRHILATCTRFCEAGIIIGRDWLTVFALRLYTSVVNFTVQKRQQQNSALVVLILVESQHRTAYITVFLDTTCGR